MKHLSVVCTEHILGTTKEKQEVHQKESNRSNSISAKLDELNTISGGSCYFLDLDLRRKSDTQVIWNMTNFFVPGCCSFCSCFISHRNCHFRQIRYSIYAAYNLKSICFTWPYRDVCNVVNKFEFS